ncbi:unnamed protein product [Caenorhabditis auriculariae]|uniref:Uncharacterized protein n=1 Tax=Caenorhabditis auriculariae TaxID=2777116 RepID=A0A8S1HEW9_9PELO|nr:unnamed protein product [Caenorhabditis auriculariae]
MGFLITSILILGATILTYLLVRHLKTRKALKRISQTRNYPIIGHALVTKPDPVGFIDQVNGLCYLFPENPRMCVLWLGPIPIVMLYSPQLVEVILTSNKHLDKGFAYKLLEPWLGPGLLTSKKEAWRPRRKLLTPTFHLEILKDFVPIFNDQARILTKKLEKYSDGEPVEVLSLITLCTLDVICETSMGKSVNAQLEEKNNEYVWAVHTINELIQERTKNPLLWNDLTYKLFGNGKLHQKCLDILHSFTRKVIDDRHRELEQSGWKFEGRLAFLDLLLEMARNGQMDRADIQAEVDTFMFEGHDTTSAGLMWALHLIGTYPEVQQKIHDELDEVLGEDDDVTVEHLPRLKYMECCLKESLRVCPSVPIVMRELATDQQLGGVTVPKGVHVLINHHLVHRDPSQWPDPERFDPDRFLPENAAKRHTYSFIPFSAGSRNCIGQRFAILEEKVILAHILRRFRIVAVEARHEVRYKVEIIMRPINGIHIQFYKR